MKNHTILFKRLAARRFRGNRGTCRIISIQPHMGVSSLFVLLARGRMEINMYTLQQLSDLEQIRTLRTVYSHFYDSQDLDGLCSLFADDAVCQWDERHGGTWRGIREIRQNYQNYFDLYPGCFSVVHSVTNHWIDLTGDTTAHGRCFLLDFNFLKTERVSPLGTVGVYDDFYRKTADGWKFQRVSLDFLWPERAILNPPTFGRSPTV